MIVANNFEPGNAGVIFYTDIAIPIIGFVLLWLQRRFERESTAPEEVPGSPSGRNPATLYQSMVEGGGVSLVVEVERFVVQVAQRR